MRKIVLSLVVLVLLAAGAAAATVFVFADQLLLSQLRKQASTLAPMRLEVGSLHLNWLGAFKLVLRQMELESQGNKAAIAEAELSSPLSLFALYKAYSAKQELPLALNLSGLKVSTPVAPPPKGGAPAPKAWPKAVPFPLKSPVPVVLELETKDADLKGALDAKVKSLKATLRAGESGAECSLRLTALAAAAGAEAMIPLSVDLKFAGSPKAVKMQRMAFQAAGIEGTGTGELLLQPVQGKLQLSMEAPDFSKLNLRPEDRAALGLIGQASGSFSVKTEVEAKNEGEIVVVGVLRFQNTLLPLKLPEHTMWSSLLKGHSIEGPLSLAAVFPFRAGLHWPFSSPPEFTVEQAAVAIDATSVKVNSPGLLTKPKGTPLKLSANFSHGTSGARIDALSVIFHALTLNGSVALPAPLGQTLDSTFHGSVSTLSGFPQLLPMLGASTAGTGAEITEAQGSITLEGRMRAYPAAPSKSLVELKSLNVKNLRLPLGYAGENFSAKGLLAGSASMQGKYDNGDLNVTQSSGSFDFSELDLVMKNKFEKRKGKKLNITFEAKGNPTRLSIPKVSLVADGLSATLSGSAAFAKNRDARLDLNTTVKAQLAPLREYLPKNLPAKVSDGSLDSQLKISGVWMPSAGLEKSPLTAVGKFTAKLGTVTMPEPPKGESPAAKTAPPGPLLPPWPIIQNARMEARVELAQFTRGALQAGGILLTGTLNKGFFTANAGVARVFGGKAMLKNLSGSLLDAKLAVSGLAAAENLDISQAAGFVDPSYGKLAKGKLRADSTFSLPSLWAESILETASCQGRAEVHDGYLSTASFDGLVNEKLKGIPGVGDKAKVSTGGLNAEIRTAFQYSKSVANLQNFFATTPKKDEMRLHGTLGLNFDADLSGEAHLASAPVTGAIREANSDPEGRLVVPVRFHGNLKSPQVDIATNAIQIMLQKTAAHEGEKLKAKAIEGAKAKAKSTLEDAAGGLLDQFKKSLKK